MSTPPIQIGPYRIVRPLGQGGMGVVYEAIQEPIERRVALKVLLPQHAADKETLTRFFNEARAVNLIEHPSIVQVSDYGQAPDGTAYLVMEHLRGETLGSRLDRLLRANQRLPWLEAVQLGAQIADALTAAHDKSIVHRDLKPGNVMLVHDPVAPGGERAKILDFGIAKLTQGQAHGTATNALIGTPQYMSPEQCRGAGGVDGKTDVYALGIMLYELLAGRPPFLGDNIVEYVGQHVFNEPPSLYDFAPSAHPPLVALIHRMLIKDKAQRPAMREVGTELARLTSIVSGAKPATSPPAATDSDETRVAVGRVLPVSTLSGSLGQTLKPAPRWRLRIVGAAGVVLAGALGLLLFWHTSGNRGATANSSIQATTPHVPASGNWGLATDSPGQTTALPVLARQPAASFVQTAVGSVPVPPPAELPPVGSATLPLDAKPDSSTPEPAVPRRASIAPVPVGESTKVNRHAAKVRTAANSSLPTKSSIASMPTNKLLKPTTPPVKRPIRYEE